MNTETQESWKEATTQLPPLLIPEIGKSIEGTLSRVDVDEKEERTFYRLLLTADAEGLDSEKEDVSFKAGTLVSVPGSGSLDYQMSCIMKDLGGARLSDLCGHTFRITRGEDDKMKEGKWKGKPVKSFRVQYK